jgi:hypothetical protein
MEASHAILSSDGIDVARDPNCNTRLVVKVARRVRSSSDDSR